jgi:(R,R)-butanediol dehydrogenase/meso-butanediol dehydrogenase/diacetyl reductase
MNDLEVPMRAAVFKKLRTPLVVETLPDPSPGNHEVVVEVCRCGICGSDLHLTEDAIFGVPPDVVLGHEYAGRVADVGRDVDRRLIGEHVAVFPVHGCGHCATCLAGNPTWCSKFRFDGGGYGQYSLAEPHQLVRLPRTLSLADGALVEPMAVSLHGVKLAQPQPGARVLIVGAGPIGLAAAYWSRRLGAGRIAVTAGSSRRAALALTLGAHVFVDPADASPAAVEAALGGPPDIVYECVGKPGLIQRCIEYCRPRGTIVVLGLCTPPDTIMPFPLVVKELKIQASAFYEVRDFELAADVLDREGDAPRAMVTDLVGLDAMPAAFEALRQRSTQCKVLVDPFG